MDSNVLVLDGPSPFLNHSLDFGFHSVIKTSVDATKSLWLPAEDILWPTGCTDINFVSEDRMYFLTGSCAKQLF